MILRKTYICMMMSKKDDIIGERNTLVLRTNLVIRIIRLN